MKYKFNIIENKALNQSVFQMLLQISGECLKSIKKNSELKSCQQNLLEAKPGQFVNVEVPSKFLRRPISICDVYDDKLLLVYKVVGEGTRIMSELKEGFELDILAPLGNGYDLSKSGNTPILIGGGVGVPPLFYLAKQLIKQDKKPKVLLGFNTKSEVFFEDEFKALGIETHVSCVDGTYGVMGFITKFIEDKTIKNCKYFYACGPLPMLKAVHSYDIDGQYSLEERMGCGFGACMGCSIKTTQGSKRVCKDGPVFNKEVLLWNEVK